MSVEEGLQRIAELVQSKEFKEKQRTFFDKYCSEFDAGEENKLSYTTIHKEYEQRIEEDIKSGVGAECLETVCVGLEKYVETRGNDEARSPEIHETIELLTSLGDFESFKLAMIERRHEQEGSAAGPKANLQEVGSVIGNAVIEVDGVMDTLREAAQAGQTGGWEEFTSTSDGSIQMDQKRSNGSVYLRWAIGVDMPPALVFEMMTGLDNPEFPIWMSSAYVKAANCVRDFGPNDKVYELEMSMPRALRYIMNIPEKGYQRLLTRSDWPQPGQFAYASVPYDMEKNVCVERLMNLKMESGVFSPIEGQQGCRVVGISLMDEMKYVPKWGLAWMMKKMVPSMMRGMETAFRKTKTYDRMMAEHAKLG